MTNPLDEDRDLVRILEWIHRTQGFDGRQYKPNYIKRRLAVRMRAVGADTYRTYGKVLEQDPEEAGALFKRLTIHVTEFFRDPDVYQALKTSVLPALESTADPSFRKWKIRAWCAGCSTGEEPYSLALTMLEWSRTYPRMDFSILATDIDETSIQTAIRGEYSETAVSRLPPSRILQGFRREGGKVSVTHEVMEKVRFKVHDLLGPWPAAWTTFDLIFCRNLLIYLGMAQQQVLYSRFHDVLNPGCFLVLGRTEALLGRARRHFECVDIPNRIYRSLVEAEGPEGGGDPGV